MRSHFLHHTKRSNLQPVSRRALAALKCQIGWEGESLRKLNHQVWGASMRGVVSKFGYVITEGEAFWSPQFKVWFCSLMWSLKVMLWTHQSEVQLCSRFCHGVLRLKLSKHMNFCFVLISWMIFLSIIIATQMLPQSEVALILPESIDLHDPMTVPRVS